MLINDPWTMVWALAIYQRWTGMDDAALAAALAMPVAALDQLRARSLPDPDELGYRTAIAQHAAAVGCNPFTLSRIIEHVARL